MKTSLSALNPPTSDVGGFHEYLRAILRGEDVRWWGDEDSEDNEDGER